MSKRAAGFTLIELMVGLALGLLATLVIAEAFLQAEGNKRAATSGADAQVTGATALYMLQRDLQAAGYGLTHWPDALGCPLSGRYGSLAVLDPAKDRLAPVMVSFGASPADSDTLTILASGQAGFAVPMKLSASHGQTDAVFSVASKLGVAANDLMLAVPATWDSDNGCALFMASAAASDTELPHAADAGWNASTAVFPAAGYAPGSLLIDLGPTPVRRRYSVDPTTWNLQVQDLLAVQGGALSAPRPVFAQVVLLKVLLGTTAASGGPVTAYGAPTLSSNADWRRLQAVRVVLVARSTQREKDEVTPNALQWPVDSLTSATVACAGQAAARCLVLDVSASGPSNEWKHYRYKVFDTVVPLRNVVWNP